MTPLIATLTVAATSAPDDCDHASLIGVIRRALEASPEFNERYAGRAVALSVPITESMNDDTYRSEWTTPEHPDDLQTLIAEMEARNPNLKLDREVAGKAFDYESRALDAEAKVRTVELLRTWVNEDGKRFVFADDLWAALGRRTRVYDRKEA